MVCITIDYSMVIGNLHILINISFHIKAIRTKVKIAPVFIEVIINFHRDLGDYYYFIIIAFKVAFKIIIAFKVSTTFVVIASNLEDYFVIIIIFKVTT